MRRATTLLFILENVAGASRLYAAFTSQQAYTLFSDRCMAYTSADNSISSLHSDAPQGVFAAHSDETIHIFCHADGCVYRCMWGTPTTTPLQKLNVIKGLKTWHSGLGTNATELSLLTSNAEDMWAWGST